MEMKISLIVSAQVTDSYGFNILAAQLKKIPDLEVRQFFIFYKFNEPYPQSVIDDLINLCQGSDLIGVSLLSSAFRNSKQLTGTLKEKIGCPIIWGGKHPTADPTDCLEYADMVCLGEGEDTLIEVVENLRAGRSIEKIPGLWVKNGEQIIKNDLRSLETDLDKFLFPDYSLDNKFILDKETMRIRPLEKRDLEAMRKWYPTMMTRGCPNCCTFCTNSSDRRLRQIRTRSIGNVIEEVKAWLAQYPDTQRIFFRDDCLSSMPLDFIKEFSRRWKAEVGLPASCSGVIATSPDFREKIALLTEAGFTDFKMGIQSGCERVRRFVFARVGETDEVIVRATKVLNDLRRGKINYYMITDNPYETEDELTTSIKFTSRLRRPFSLSLYSLNFYPGTPIYDRALRDGFLKSKEEALQESTMILKNTYLNKVFLLMRFFEIPPFVADFLANLEIYRRPGWQKFFSGFYKFLFKVEIPVRLVPQPRLKKIIRQLVRQGRLDLKESARWLVWVFLKNIFIIIHRTTVR